MKTIAAAGLLGAALVGAGGYLGLPSQDNPSETGSITSTSRILEADPRTAMNVVKVDWRRAGFGLTSAVDVSVRNNNGYPVRVDRVSCRFKSKSGEIEDHAQGVYDVIQPRTEKVIRDVALGFVSEQDKGLDCSVTGARKDL